MGTDKNQVGSGEKLTPQRQAVLQVIRESGDHPTANDIFEAARKRLIAVYDHDVTEPEWALGYRWDIVVRGPYVTPFESKEGGR